MTVTDIEAVELEDLDFATPCHWIEYRHHGDAVTAEWVIWLRWICPDQGNDLLYMCDPCKEWWMNASLLYCQNNGAHTTTPAELVIRLERI